MPSPLTSRPLRIAVVAALALAVALAPASSAATHHSGPAAPQPAESLPAFVHLPADQAAHPGASIEWWYTIGHLSSFGHEYGYEVDLTNAGVTELAITDITAGKYYTQQVAYNPGEYSLSPTALDVHMPDATLSGPMGAMRLTATLPQGSLDPRLDATGPAMYANGAGLFPLLGGSSYYYSLPNLRTSGTLTLGGKTSAVTGQSWLDRQWGAWDWNQLDKWTWMAVQLDNGESINLWDVLGKQGEQQWATVLHRDGSESVVPVTPLATDATDFQTSSTTGQRYAGSWTVTIPSLNTRLTVTATPTLQEIQAHAPFSPGINEAASAVAGSYQGQPVAGNAYVEQLGIWK